MLKTSLLIVAALMLDIGETDSKPSSKKEVGTAKYYFGPFKLYRATLLAENGRYDASTNFDLTLEYYRKISAEKLANASIVEMARLNDRPEEDYEFLRSPLEKCFGDVAKGDVITGRKVTDDKTEFYRNDNLSCSLEEPNFSNDFFAIWLSPEGRYPDKTADLVGNQSPIKPPQ